MRRDLAKVPGDAGFAGIRAVDKNGKRFVYVLQSMRHRDRHYIGLTDDLRGRLAAHNNGQSPQTAKHAPWRVQVVIQFSSDEVAARFEKFLKSSSGREFSRCHFE
jgi:predicted GIY-YIG superfamily endonuclease